MEFILQWVLDIVESTLAWSVMATHCWFTLHIFCNDSGFMKILKNGKVLSRVWIWSGKIYRFERECDFTKQPLFCKWQPLERPKQHTQQCLVGSGLGWRGRGQKSAGQISVKFVLQYCHTFFTLQHLAGSWVHTYLGAVISLGNPHPSETLDNNISNLEVSCTTRHSQPSFH